LTFTTSYTWSHNIDNVGASDGGRNQPLGSFTGDFYNRAANRASSNGDRRQRFVGSYVYSIPGLFQDSSIGKSLLGGWSLGGVTTIQSGRPFSITDSQGGTIYGANSYAQFVAGKSASDAKLEGRTQDRLDRYFDTSVFEAPPLIGNGRGFGNVGRNILTGPGQANFDMNLKKSFALPQISDASNMEFRAEFFNVFNHANFGNPGNARATPATFGQITTTTVAPRIIQFALKYQF